MNEKQIDKTAGRVGAAMRTARRNGRMSVDDVTEFLRINADDLRAYERGIREVPQDILERICTIGYYAISVRRLDTLYRRKRRFYTKCADVIAE